MQRNSTRASHRSWKLLTPLALLALLCLTAPAAAEEPYAETPAEETEGHGGEGHADPGHGAHGGKHGGVHHISNWLHWPSEEHPNGPFAFALLNFIILIYVVVRLGKKPFVNYLETRHATVRDNLAEATRLRDEAEEKLGEIKAKLDNLKREIAEIKEGVKKDAELEKERIIADATAHAAQLVHAAERTLEDELKRARRMLEREAVSAAMTAGEKLIRKQLNDADRKRINDEYFKQINS